MAARPVTRGASHPKLIMRLELKRTARRLLLVVANIQLLLGHTLRCPTFRNRNYDENRRRHFGTERGTGAPYRERTKTAAPLRYREKTAIQVPLAPRVLGYKYRETSVLMYEDTATQNHFPLI